MKDSESATSKIAKNVKLMDLKNLEAQKKIMLEAAELVNNLIENKLSLSGFNADDEINLNGFLSTVSAERQFNKHYRELADAWMEEIAKPSRRFKKMTVEDLEIDKKIQNKKHVITRSEPKDGEDIYVD